MAAGLGGPAAVPDAALVAGIRAGRGRRGLGGGGARLHLDHGPGAHVLEALAVRLAGLGVAGERVERVALVGDLLAAVGPLQEREVAHRPSRALVLRPERVPGLRARAGADEVALLL